jgi:molybdopterin adenylyltransferase
MSIPDIQRKHSDSSKGSVVAVNISETTGTPKRNVGRAEILMGFGIRDDAHGGDWHRQVSLLAEESISTMRQRGLDVGWGDFAENITTRGLSLVKLPLGSRLRVGSSVILEVTQIGKECHSRCSVYDQAGTCIMPTEGIFTRVLSGGHVTVGDTIEIIRNE